MNSTRVLRRLAAAALLAVGSATTYAAPEPGGQQAAGTKTYTPGRTADGQPDIQGRWDPEVSGTFDITDPKTGGARLDELLNARGGATRARKPSRIVDPVDGKVPYQPWAAAKQAEMARHADDPSLPEHIDPQARCLPGGVPRELFHSETKILQPPGYVVLLQAQNHVSRLIRLDDTRRPLADSVKLWMGESRGRWEGNTLVVDVANQNAKGRFDMIGNFATDHVRMVERWTIVGPDAIEYQVRVEDPAAYTRPFTIAARLKRERARNEPYADEYWEDACHEGERSAEHMVVPKAAETK